MHNKKLNHIFIIGVIYDHYDRRNIEAVKLYDIQKKKVHKKERDVMLNDEICKKRDELNKSIENNEEYSKIYKLSVELDELIAKYYEEEQKKKE